MKYQIIVGNTGQVRDTGDKREALAAFREYVEQSKNGYGRASDEPVTMLTDGEIFREYAPKVKFPKIKNLRSLFIELKKDIRDDYRAREDMDYDDEETAPSMCVTIGANEKGEWSYQTGDNSYSGGAYRYPNWAVVTLTRRSNSAELAREAVGQLAELQAY